MKVCKAFLAALFVFLSGLPLCAQGDKAVLLEGVVLKGVSHFLSNNTKLSDMSASQSIFPGVEVRFNQNGRTTIGLGYQRWKLEDALLETYLMEFPECGERRTIGGCPIGDSRLITLHPQTGEPLASVTKKSQAEANILSLTVYTNLLTRGRIRPFVALGGGVAFNKEIISTTSFVHPDFKEIIGYQFQFERPENSYDIDSLEPTVRGLAGVNIFPGVHTVASFSGGYSSGAVFNFSFGFIF